jgi:transcriptional regulator with XRE-family HTH domain
MKCSKGRRFGLPWQAIPWKPVLFRDIHGKFMLRQPSYSCDRRPNLLASWTQDEVTAMSFPDNLRTLRLTRGLTQPALAEKAGIEQSYLSKLENGRSRPSEDVVARLAQALDIKPEALTQNGDESEDRLRRWKRAGWGAIAAAVLAVTFLAGRATAVYPLSLAQVIKGSSAMEDPTPELIKLAPGTMEIGMISRSGKLNDHVFISGESHAPNDLNVYMDALRKHFGGSFQDIQTTPYLPGQNQHFSMTLLLSAP